MKGMIGLVLELRIFQVGIILASTALHAATAASGDLFRGVPKDSAAAYFVAGPGDASKDGNNGANGSIGAAAGSSQRSLAMADFWISHAQELGLFSSLDKTCRAWLDGLGMAMVILRYPHAVTLIDLDAISLENGHHAVRQLRAAVIVHTKGRNDEIEKRIQHLLNAYTNKDESALRTETVAEHRVTTLRDRRLLEWAIFQWGAIGDDYVLALGDGAYERIEATLKDETKSIASEAWFMSSTSKLSAEAADFFGIANFESLRRGSDAPLWKRIHVAARELHLDGVDQAAIALTMKNRDIDVTALLQHGDENLIVPLTIREAEHVKSLVAQTIPPDAGWNLMLDIAPHEWSTCISSAYNVGRRADARREMQRETAQLEADAGISIDKDIFAPLGRGIIIHDYPRHAFRLPLAWTWLIRISGDPAKLRQNIDKLFGVWRERLGETNPLQLRRAEDGLWFLYFGLEGPALKVEEQWIVVSFSPEAVRENAKYVRSKTANGTGSTYDRAP
ncbi:MAG: hypothetical protein HY287_15990 [Planctomycetes bacterium]|nr:hypothetical protein [Planctomycetota bacterium]